MVAEMLADADGRSSLLQSGSAGRQDDAFYIRSGDDFELRVRGQLQFRYIFNFGDEGDDSFRDDEFESGFQARRTKLIFEGTVFGNMDYKINGNFDSQGGSFDLQDAWVRYRFDDSFALRFGQFKLPFLREELVLSQNQLAVERSYVNELWNQDRSQAIELEWRAMDLLKIWFAFSDGMRSANTEFTDSATVSILDFDGDGVGDAETTPRFGFANFDGAESDAALTLRGEFLAAGEWTQFADFTGMPEDTFGLLIGAAVHWETVDDGSVLFNGVEVAEGNSDYISWTVDVSVEGAGWNVFAAYVGSFTDLELNEVGGSGVEGNFEPTDHGFIVQGGFFIPETKVEIFGRYDVAIFDDNEREVDEDTFNTVTAGFNYYIHGHAAKFTTDVVYFIDDFNPIQDSDLGSGRVGGGDDDEWAWRLQFQLLF